MKKKQPKLTSGYPLDFDLIGIVSPVKEYQLAWHLNQTNEFHLVKADDIRIEFEDNVLIRVSALAEVGEHRSVYLMRNKLVSSSVPATQYLLQELQQFDYLLKLSSESDENWAKELLLRLKEIPIIDYCLLIDVNKIKMKDNLVF